MSGEWSALVSRYGQSTEDIEAFGDAMVEIQEATRHRVLHRIATWMLESVDAGESQLGPLKLVVSHETDLGADITDLITALNSLTEGRHT